MTFDYGVRFLLYSPYYRPDKQVANFDPSRYDPSQAPRLYQPALVNGTRVGRRSGDGPDAESDLHRRLRARARAIPANGMVLQTDPGVPQGFRKMLAAAAGAAARASRGISPAPERRSCTRAPASSTTRVSAADRSGNLRQSALHPQPDRVQQHDVEHVRSPGVTLLGSPRHRRSARDRSTRRRAPTTGRSVCGARSAGARSVDATYAGYLGAQHGDVLRPQRGARRRAQPDSASGEPRPDGSATTALPADFLRPFLGYGSIRVRGNSATGDYHALQVQVNRRYIHGVQFGAAYTLQRARGLRRRGSRQPLDFAQPSAGLVLQRAGAEQPARVSSINYSWDLPGGGRGSSTIWRSAPALDGWQLSGENASSPATGPTSS